MVIQLEEAERIAKDFMSGLNLPYEISCGQVRHANNREYSVSVTLSDDETSLSFRLYLDSETGKIREEAYWRPTAEQIKTAMGKEKQFYIVCSVENRESAKKLGEKLFEEEGVMNVEVGNDKGFFRMIRNHIGNVGLHGQTTSRGIELYKNKPEEDARDEILKKTYISW